MKTMLNTENGQMKNMETVHDEMAESNFVATVLFSVFKNLNMNEID